MKRGPGRAFAVPRCVLPFQALPCRAGRCSHHVRLMAKTNGQDFACLWSVVP